MSTVDFVNFVYTGNHVNGQNSGNYEEVIDWARTAGLDIRDESDDLDLFWDRLETIPGTHELRLNGRVLVYTVQALKGSNEASSFGYTMRRRLTAIEVC